MKSDDFKTKIASDAFNLAKVLKEEFNKILSDDFTARVKYHPISDGAAIFEVDIAKGNSNPVTFSSVKFESAGEALSTIPQHAFGGNINNIRFGGINIIAEQTKVIFIKGADLSSKWDRKMAKEMTLRFMNNLRRPG